MEWNITSCHTNIPESELPNLHKKAVDLLDLLQKNLPEKTGENAAWNFEKAHSILHKVHDIVLWGNSKNTLCQAPEVGLGWRPPKTSSPFLMINLDDKVF